MDWSLRYAELSEMMLRVCRLCPRLPVLGISTLHPRHAPPPAQLQLLRELGAQTPPRRRVPSLVSLAIRWLRCAVFASQATLGIAALNIRFRSELKRLSREPARVILRTWRFGPPAQGVGRFLLRDAPAAVTGPGRLVGLAVRGHAGAV